MHSSWPSPRLRACSRRNWAPQRGRDPGHSLPRPLPPTPLDPALHRRGGKGGAAMRCSGERRRCGAAQPRRAQVPRSGTPRSAAQSPSGVAPRAGAADSARSRWARPGAAFQWASPAQLRVNLALQLALPSAAGILAPQLDSAAGPRPASSAVESKSCTPVGPPLVCGHTSTATGLRRGA